jgi:hypothetical protein
LEEAANLSGLQQEMQQINKLIAVGGAQTSLDWRKTVLQTLGLLLAKAILLINGKSSGITFVYGFNGKRCRCSKLPI